ncbi:hypothetical protein [Amycolatopsis sp. NPDC058986]|uniref:hypothetical protein n=1 Tax=unclassified Amycolatopsis TaxID=2618356 RepID=UPI00366B7964
MSTIDLAPHGAVAISGDIGDAAYPVADWLRTTRPAGPGQASRPVRIVVEVLRRLGGITPRALIGGEFTPSTTRETHLAVGVAGYSLFDADDKPICPSRLWNQPFTAGLPPEFGPTVLDTLGALTPVLPAGTLTLDRAAFDLVNSSEQIFAQAATVLHAVVTAHLTSGDSDAAARTVIETW